MFTVRDGCPFCLSGSRRTAVGAGLSSGLSLALVLGPEVLFFLGLVVRFVLLVFLNRLFQPLKLSGENLVISFVYTPRRLRQPPSPPPGKGNIPVRCLHARRPHKKVPLPGGGDGMSMGGGQAPARGAIDSLTMLSPPLFVNFICSACFPARTHGTEAETASSAARRISAMVARMSGAL